MENLILQVAQQSSAFETLEIVNDRLKTLAHNIEGESEQQSEVVEQSIIKTSASETFQRQSRLLGCVGGFNKGVRRVTLDAGTTSPQPEIVRSLSLAPETPSPLEVTKPILPVVEKVIPMPEPEIQVAVPQVVEIPSVEPQIEVESPKKRKSLWGSVSKNVQEPIMEKPEITVAEKPIVPAADSEEQRPVDWKKALAKVKAVSSAKKGMMSKKKRSVFSVASRMERVETTSKELFASVKWIKDELPLKADKSEMVQLTSTVGDFDVQLDSIREKVVSLSTKLADDFNSNTQSQIQSIRKEINSLSGQVQLKQNAKKLATKTLESQWKQQVEYLTKELEDLKTQLQGTNDRCRSQERTIEDVRRALRKKAELKDLNTFSQKSSNEETADHCAVRCLSCHQPIYNDDAVSDEHEDCSTGQSISGGNNIKRAPKVYRSNIPLSAVAAAANEDGQYPNSVCPSTIRHDRSTHSQEPLMGPLSLVAQSKTRTPWPKSATPFRSKSGSSQR